MRSLAMTTLLDSEFGGAPSFHARAARWSIRWFFDSAARELHALAAQGRVEIVNEHRLVGVGVGVEGGGGGGGGGDALIDKLSFKRLQ